MIATNAVAGSVVYYVSLLTRAVYVGTLVRPGHEAVVDGEHGPEIIDPTYCFTSHDEARAALIQWQRDHEKPQVNLMEVLPKWLRRGSVRPPDPV